MAPRALKVGLVSLCGCTVAYGANETASANTTITTTTTTTTTTTALQSGPLSLLDGSLSCRMLPCTWANSEPNKQASCPAGDCVWSAMTSTCSPSLAVNQAMSMASISGDMTAMFGNSFMGRMMQATMTCATKAQAACTGDCAWGPTANGTSACGPDPFKWFLGPEMQRQMQCSGKTNQQECASAGCMWTLDVMRNPPTFGCTLNKADTMELSGCRTTNTPFALATTPAPSPSGSAVVDSVYCRTMQCTYANAAPNKQASCVGNCQWQASTSSCSMSASLLLEQVFVGGNTTLLYGNQGPYPQLMAADQRCQSKTQAACSGDCTWESSTSRCGVSMARSMEFHRLYHVEMTEYSTCSSKNTSEACLAAGCLWPEGVMSNCLPKKATSDTLFGCSGTFTSAASEPLMAGASWVALALWAGAWAAGLAGTA